MPKTQSPPEIEKAPTADLTPRYHVVLLDDNDHTFDYVIEMLTSLFYMSTSEAFRHAEQVHSQGRTIVITCEYSAAQYARDQILAYGPDRRLPRSQGSMKAVLEPAESGPETV